MALSFFYQSINGFTCLHTIRKGIFWRKIAELFTFRYYFSLAACLHFSFRWKYSRLSSIFFKYFLCIFIFLLLFLFLILWSLFWCAYCCSCWKDFFFIFIFHYYVHKTISSAQLKLSSVMWKIFFFIIIITKTECKKIKKKRMKIERQNENNNNKLESKRKNEIIWRKKANEEKKEWILELLVDISTFRLQAMSSILSINLINH